MFVQVTGLDGAGKLAETLRSRGVKKLEFVSDEGLTVLNDIVPGIRKPVALYVGINSDCVWSFSFLLSVGWTELLFSPSLIGRQVLCSFLI